MPETSAITTIRDRLMAFDDPTLDAFIHDNYFDVYNRFSRGLLKDEKITLLLDHCRRREGELDRLDAAVKAWPAGRTSRVAPPTPYQVPRDIPPFVGRAEELAALEAALTGGQAAAVCGLAGLGGIGKSALAAHFASLYRGRFPDGVLYASLRDPEPLAVLGVLAQAYGADLSAYPDPAARLAAVRSLLSGKQALIILDNAEELGAVRQILPCCGERCAVLVTTRDAGLAAAIGQVVRLSLLAEEDSMRLLKAWAGEKTVEADPAAAARACDLLGNLPLAVEIAAKLAGLRGWGMAELERRLRAERGRLGVLELKDLAVRASFQLSYDLLDEGQRAFFAALGAFRGLSFDAEAAVVVAEVGDAAGPLDALGDLSLVWPEEAGRFRQHTLLADYALERLREAGREAALLERHARHYAAVARAANELYQQGGDGVLRGLALFDLEWPHIRRGQAWAAAKSAEDDRAAALASDYPDACAYCLSLRLPPRDRLPWLEVAAAAARRLGERMAEGVHLGNLGLAYAALGDARRAIGCYEQALAIAKEIRAASWSEAERTDARYHEGNNLGNLGNTCYALGDARGAIGYYEQALAIAWEIRVASRSEAERAAARQGEGNHLGNLGIAYAALGDARRAIGYYEQALAIAREIGDRQGEGNHLGNLGIAYKNLGEMQRAIGYYEQALAIDREIGDRRGEGTDLTNLGVAHETLGDPARARELWTQALAIFEAIESPNAATVRGWIEEIGPP